MVYQMSIILLDKHLEKYIFERKNLIVYINWIDSCEKLSQLQIN